MCYYFGKTFLGSYFFYRIHSFLYAHIVGWTFPLSWTPVTKRRNVTSQDAEIFNYSTVKSSKLDARSQNCGEWILASSCLSVRPHGATRLALEGYSWNLIFEYFSKICWKLQLLLKSGHEDLRRFMITPCWVLLRITNVSGKVVKKTKTYFIPNKLLPKIMPFMRKWTASVV